MLLHSLGKIGSCHLPSDETPGQGISVSCLFRRQDAVAIKVKIRKCTFELTLVNDAHNRHPYSQCGNSQVHTPSHYAVEIFTELLYFSRANGLIQKKHPFAINWCKTLVYFTQWHTIVDAGSIVVRDHNKETVFMRFNQISNGSYQAFKRPYR